MQVMDMSLDNRLDFRLEILLRLSYDHEVATILFVEVCSIRSEKDHGKSVNQLSKHCADKWSQCQKLHIRDSRRNREALQQA